MPIATCHCQSVRIAVVRLPETFTSCNCSICRRLGALWAYYTAGEVTIDTGAAGTQTYIQGDRKLAMHHCAKCGCTTHYVGLEPGTDRVGVNARMMEPAAIAGIRIRPFDGAESWTFLD